MNDSTRGCARMLRHLLAACAVAIAFGGGAASTDAHAAGPAVKKQAPGFYRMMLGDFEVTALWDGSVGLPMDQYLKGVTPARLKTALDRGFLALPVDTSVNGYLVNTGAKLVLIDAGAGAMFGPTLGGVVANLQAAGYTADQVDEIYITHLHADHVGGLIADGKPVFANAVVRADQRDVDYWLSPSNMENAPADAKDFFKAAMAALEPYRAAGRLKPFDGATELVPGVRAIAAHGHTPGHTVYAVESKGQKLVLWGDLLHVGAVQFPDPSVTIAFDVDQRAAREQRRKAFADAARGRDWIAAAHLPFPGIGHIRPEGKGYAYVPANYTAPR